MNQDNSSVDSLSDTLDKPEAAAPGTHIIDFGPPQGHVRNDMAVRLQDLQRRERELEAREQAFDQRQEHIRRHGRNNWPLASYPLLYHDIEDEVLPENRPTMRRMYQTWLLLVFVLVFNLVSGVLLTVSGRGLSDLIMAVIYLPVIAVLSFLTWYRPVYNGFMKEHALFFYMFLIFGTCHAVYCIYMLIGPPGCGSGGFFTMISAFTNSAVVAGAFCAVSTFGWLVETLAFIWLFGVVWRHTKGDKGYTWSQAKTEAQMHGIRAYIFRGKSVY